MKLVLKIFEEFSAEISKGEPLVFRLTLMNTEKLEDYQKNKSIDEDIEQLKAEMEAGEITEEEYEKQVASLEEKKTILEHPLFGSEETPWDNQVRFTPEWLKPETLSREPDSNILSLTPDKTPYVMFGLKPEETAQLEAQVYRVKVTLGDVESNEVGVMVSDEEGELDAVSLADKARYLIMVGAVAEGLKHIDKLLEENPMDIEGLIMKGDYHVLVGEKDAAIAAYERAIEAYNATGPNEDDPPRVIISKLSRLMVTREDEE